MSEPEEPKPSASSGRLAAVEERVVTIAAQVSAVPGKILRPTAYLYLVLLGLGAAGAITSLAYAGDKFDERSDKRIGPAIKASEERQAEALRKALAEAEAKAAARAEQLKAEVMAKVTEVQVQQVRAEEVSARRFEVTINTVLEGRLQPGTRQLSQPQTDGGRP